MNQTKLIIFFPLHIHIPPFNFHTHTHYYILWFPPSLILRVHLLATHWVSSSDDICIQYLLMRYRQSSSSQFP